MTSNVSEPSTLALLQSETHHHLTVARLSSYQSMLKTTAGQVLGWPIRNLREGKVGGAVFRADHLKQTTCLRMEPQIHLPLVLFKRYNHKTVNMNRHYSTSQVNGRWRFSTPASQPWDFSTDFCETRNI